jgi:tRNA A37 methylthiotransferase MiaB
MKKVFITSGIICDKRKLDLNQIKQYLIQNDYEVVDKPSKADFILISTCGVSEAFAKISFDKIKEFNKYSGKVVVTGCLPDTDKKRFDELFKGASFSTRHIDEIEKYFPGNVRFSEIEDCNSLWMNVERNKISDIIKLGCLKFDFTKKIYVGFFHQIFRNILGENHLILHSFYALNLPIDDLYIIRIATGCWGNCAYCASKNAVGEFKSKPFNICINEFKRGLEHGYTNFFLTAEDTGGYGLDINSNFAALLREMVNIKGDYWINIYALNPQWVVQYIDELEQIVRKGKIKAICIPIQSGNRRILQQMHRYPDIEKITNALIRLKKADPNLSLATHCIVGYPSETEREFKETLDFIKATDIDLGFVSSISIKTDTEAETIEPKVSKREISTRVKYAQKYLNNFGYKTFRVKDIFVFHKKK